jgi:hypothetical protein
VRYRSHARLAIGRRLRLWGVLTSPAGQPLAGAPIEVLSRPRHGDGPFVPDGAAATDRRGRFSSGAPHAKGL